jgi:DNA polymerase-3 subunit beta
MEKTAKAVKKAAQDSKKKVVLKFPEGFGTYVAGEIHEINEKTEAVALRRAGQNLGIEPAAWQFGEVIETKNAITVKVIRKVQPPEQAAAGSQEIGAPEASRSSAEETIAQEAAPIVARIEGGMHQPVDLEAPAAEIVEAAPLQEGTGAEAPAEKGDEDVAFGPEAPAAEAKGKKGRSKAKKEQEPEVPAIVTIGRADLLDALKVCLAVAGSGSGMIPTLSHVLLSASGSELVLSSTALDIAYTKSVGCATSDKVVALVPAKVLAQEVKALPSDVTEIELQVTTRAGNRAVSVNGRCSIHGMDPEEFPELPSGFDQIVTVRNLKESMARVLPAVSKDELRYALTGLYLDFVEGQAVGTDGFRLHIAEIEAAGAPVKSVLLPSKAVQAVLKFKGEDEIHFREDGRFAAFYVNGGLLSARLMEGNFPDYKGVMPHPPVQVTFAASEFLKLIEGAAPIADGYVCLCVNGDLRIHASRDVGRYEWRIPATREGGEGKELSYHFNPEYLVAAIKCYPAERVRLALPDGEYGAVTVNEKAVLMPVRI